MVSPTVCDNLHSTVGITPYNLIVFLHSTDGLTQKYWTLSTVLHRQSPGKFYTDQGHLVFYNFRLTLMPACSAQATNFLPTFAISHPAIQMMLSTFHLQWSQVRHPTHHHHILKHLSFQPKNGTHTRSQNKVSRDTIP